MRVFAEFKDEERSGWFIGIGRAMMTRASLFRETKGVAVEMVNRVYDLPPFSGTFHFLILKPLVELGVAFSYRSVQECSHFHAPFLVASSSFIPLISRLSNKNVSYFLSISQMTC